MTTIHGHARHAITKNMEIITQKNQSYIMDSSYPSDYHFFASVDNIQLNLTMPKEVLNELILDNFGHYVPNQLWLARTGFGVDNKGWLALLQYVYQFLIELPANQLQHKAGEHLQQMIGLHIVNAWANKEKIDLFQKDKFHPHYISRAVDYIHANFQHSPTIVDVAKAVGVSVRTLTSSFKKSQHITVGEMMRKVRLEKARHLLLLANATDNVMNIAYACGYINLSDFARQYKKKYGELPSMTIKKRKFAEKC